MNLSQKSGRNSSFLLIQSTLSIGFNLSFSKQGGLGWGELNLIPLNLTFPHFPDHKGGGYSLPWPQTARSHSACLQREGCRSCLHVRRAPCSDIAKAAMRQNEQNHPTFFSRYLNIESETREPEDADGLRPRPRATHLIHENMQPIMISLFAPRTMTSCCTLRGDRREGEGREAELLREGSGMEREREGERPSVLRPRHDTAMQRREGGREGEAASSPR